MDGRGIGPLWEIRWTNDRPVARCLRLPQWLVAEHFMPIIFN